MAGINLACCCPTGGVTQIDDCVSTNISAPNQGICWCLSPSTTISIDSGPDLMTVPDPGGALDSLKSGWPQVVADASVNPWPGPITLNTACQYIYSGPDRVYTAQDGVTQQVWAIFYVARGFAVGNRMEFNRAFFFRPYNPGTTVLDPGEPGDELTHASAVREFNTQLTSGGQPWILNFLANLPVNSVNALDGFAASTDLNPPRGPYGFSGTIANYLGYCRVTEWFQSYNLNTGLWSTPASVGTKCYVQATADTYFTDWRKTTCKCPGETCGGASDNFCLCCYRTFTKSCDPAVAPPPPTPLSGAPALCSPRTYRSVHTYTIALTCGSNTHYVMTHTQALVDTSSPSFPTQSTTWVRQGAGSLQWKWTNVLATVQYCCSSILADPAPPSTPSGSPNGEVFRVLFSYTQTVTCPSTWGAVNVNKGTTCVEIIGGVPADDTSWTLQTPFSGNTRTFFWRRYIDPFAVTWPNPTDPNPPPTGQSGVVSAANCCPAVPKQIVIGGTGTAVGTYRLVPAATAESWVWDGNSGPGWPGGTTFPRTNSATLQHSGNNWLMSIVIRTSSSLTCTTQFQIAATNCPQSLPAGSWVRTLNTCGSTPTVTSVTDTV